MYIVAWSIIKPNETISDWWVTHEKLEDAQKHYKKLKKADYVFTASICNILESTDYETNA